jgi:membrane associated rhomboid family serine protease
MLLPIGHDQTTVRRMPWVTFGIMASCILVFLWTLIAPGDRQAVVDAELEAVEYFLDHPYLELDPAVKGYLYYSLRQTTGDPPAPPTDASLLDAEQRQLDTLVAAFFEARDRLPHWRWGLVPAELEPTALVTHTFVHAGWMHLIGNLFILYLVGPALEDAWGRPLFGAFYVVAGAVAALVFVAKYPNLAEPLIGASGAVAGVMGAFAVRYWNTNMTFFYFVWMIRIYKGTFQAPAWLMLGLWALGELAFAMGLWAYTSLVDLGDVGFLAHVGGFVFGVAAAYVVAHFGIERRFVEPALERRETVHDATAVETAIELARSGRSAEAMVRLSNELERNPGDADAAAALWNIGVTAGEPERVAPAVARAVGEAARTGNPGLPAQCWAELIRAVPGISLDPRIGARVAELLMRENMHGDVEETLHWLARQVSARTPDGILVRLARLAHRLSIEMPFATLALERPDLSPELRAELQSFSGFSA